MRNFYLLIKKGQTVSALLTWSHYVELLKLDNINEIKYYIYISEKENLSVRDLSKRIKSNEYERIGYKEEIKEPKINTLIKNPIIINAKNKVDNDVSEYALHKFILEDMDNFLKELGEGFSYIGHEVGIKIGNNNHYIDFLLFNYKYNCFVVVEIKVVKLNSEYIGQIQTYMNYVDRNMKSTFNDRTVGVIICKRGEQSLPKRNHLLKQQICFV